MEFRLYNKFPLSATIASEKTPCTQRFKKATLQLPSSFNASVPAILAIFCLVDPSCIVSYGNTSK